MHPPQLHCQSDLHRQQCVWPQPADILLHSKHTVTTVACRVMGSDGRCSPASCGTNANHSHVRDLATSPVCVCKRHGLLCCLMWADGLTQDTFMWALQTEQKSIIEFYLQSFKTQCLSDVIIFNVKLSGTRNLWKEKRKTLTTKQKQRALCAFTNLDEMFVDPFRKGFLLHPVPLIWGTQRRKWV